MLLSLAVCAEPVSAQFRGCESAGWCKFRVEPRDALQEPLRRVRPGGIPEMRGDDAISIAVRDRLNVMLSSFVHQHKRIVLHDLRELGDGTFTATVTVNESELESDSVLQELQAKRGEAGR
ncbi:MAG TPA: hypothetical protein VF460_05935 [Burkholderiales bacterium]